MEIALHLPATYIPAKCKSIESYENGILSTSKCPRTCFCYFPIGKVKLHEVKTQLENTVLNHSL